MIKLSRALSLLCSAGIFLSSAIPAFAQTSTQSGGLQVSEPANSNTVRTQKQQRPKIGLCLGGGGARGAAHVGVLKVLLEEGVPIDVVAGTSIGSVVGGFYAAGVPIEKLSEEFGDSRLMKNFMTVPISVRVLIAPILFAPRLIGFHPYDGLYRGGKFRTYANNLAGDKHSIDQLTIPYAAVVTDLVSGESCRLSKGDLGTAMQASTAVPGLRKPVEIDGHLYCDGGLINNLPVDHVKALGADFVIAVNIDEPMEPTPISHFRKAGSVSKQALKIQLFNLDKNPSKTANITIHPDTSGISLISRKKSDGCRGIEAGEQAARAIMPEIRAKLAALGVELPAKQASVSISR